MKVYKVFVIESDGLHSPFFPFSWGDESKFGEEIHVGAKVPVVQEGELCDYVFGDSFHSFEWRATAEYEAKTISRENPTRLHCVAECTIPEYTKFLYEGTYGGGGSYASESIIIRSICSKFFEGIKDPDIQNIKNGTKK